MTFFKNFVIMIIDTGAKLRIVSKKIEVNEMECILNLLATEMSPVQKLNFIIQSSRHSPLSEADREKVSSLLKTVKEDGKLSQAHVTWATSEGISLPA